MTTITIDRATVEQALEALDEADTFHRNLPDQRARRLAAMAALRAALAQQAEPLNLSDPAVQKRLASQWGYVPAAQESVPAAVVGTQSDVWRGYNGQWQAPGEPIKTVQMLRDLPMGTLLYTAPPQRKPLPKQDQHCVDVPGYGLTAVRLVRAVERAHGIKE